jgi:hypothetical protein
VNIPVAWSDEADDAIAGDLTAAIAYVTPAGGVVVTAVATCGVRDRGAGALVFTTSLGLSKKVIDADLEKGFLLLSVPP